MDHLTVFGLLSPSKTCINMDPKTKGAPRVNQQNERLQQIWLALFQTDKNAITVTKHHN